METFDSSQLTRSIFAHVEGLREGIVSLLRYWILDGLLEIRSQSMNGFLVEGAFVKCFFRWLPVNFISSTVMKTMNRGDVRFHEQFPDIIAPQPPTSAARRARTVNLGSRS
jgi:hypothetical protein